MYWEWGGTIGLSPRVCSMAVTRPDDQRGPAHLDDRFAHLDLLELLLVDLFGHGVAGGRGHVLDGVARRPAR